MDILQQLLPVVRAYFYPKRKNIKKQILLRGYYRDTARIYLSGICKRELDIEFFTDGPRMALPLGTYIVDLSILYLLHLLLSNITLFVHVLLEKDKIHL